jgi:hypothetical protein
MANYGYDLGRIIIFLLVFSLFLSLRQVIIIVKTPSPNFDDRISKFLAPAYVNLGIGISYNPNENFK